MTSNTFVSGVKFLKHRDKFNLRPYLSSTSSNSPRKRTDKLFREEDLPSHYETELYLRNEIQKYFPINPRAPLNLSIVPRTQHGQVTAPHHVLIKLAIWGSPGRRRTLSQIIKDVEAHFPEMADLDGKPQPWKDSFRHKLSNDEKFVQIMRPHIHTGRGHYWVIHVGQQAKTPAPRERKTKKRRDTAKSFVSTISNTVPENVDMYNSWLQSTRDCLYSPYPPIYSSVTATDFTSSPTIPMLSYEYQSTSLSTGYNPCDEIGYYSSYAQSYPVHTAGTAWDGGRYVYGEPQYNTYMTAAMLFGNGE